VILNGPHRKNRPDYFLFAAIVKEATTALLNLRPSESTFNYGGGELTQICIRAAP
jgi:hypothetical protein